MHRSLVTIAALLALFYGAAAVAPAAQADGFIIPDRPEQRVRGDWAVTYHKVDVSVVGQKARVTVDQEFENLGSRVLEATYVFPLPVGAMISAVQLRADGVNLEGKLLRREEARRVYEDIVRKMKDPLLVEYLGRDMFQASLFPIPPRGRRQVTLQYDHLLTKDGESFELVYPLNTEKFSAKPLHDVRVVVDLESPTAIGPIYSPSHEVAVVRKDGRHAQVSFEARNVRPETDFLLYWSSAEKDVGATLLTHWPRGEDRGYFLLLASPSEAEGTAYVAKPKDLTICVDVSGSMAGEKMEQARAAVRQVIGGLNDGDRFNVISYASAVVPLWDAVQPATSANRAEATKFVDGLKAIGATNIHDALKAALADPGTPGMPKVVLFLTDGRPTMGESTDPEQIVRQVGSWNGKAKARVFAFGVGVDVNSVLLDRLALQNHGTPTYVRPQEDVERKVASLYEKIRYPVLTDVQIAFGGMSASEVLPASVPDLFRGGQLVVAGRYRKGGPVDVVISGRDGDAGREYPYRLTAGAEGQGLRDDFPARVWAMRRIADLVDAIRLSGRREKELVDEIVALSTKFGILTEYTAFLADETSDHGRVAENARQALSALDALRGRAEGGWGFAQGWNQAERRAADKPAAPAAPPAGDAAGGSGAAPAQSLGFLKSAEGDKDVEEETLAKGGGIRQVGNRAFYKRAQAWVDVDVKDASKVDESVRRWTPRFFELLATTTSDENARLSQEGSVLLRLQGKNVLVTD
jgi:Ca-activated chloride channel family protein